MKKRIWLGALLFILISVISWCFDKEIIIYIAKLRNPLLDAIFLIITSWIFGIVILFILFMLIFMHAKKKEKYWILPTTLIISFIVNYILKSIIQNPRPFQIGLVETLDILREANANSSFPSLHAMLAFCIIPLLSKIFPKANYIFWAGACLIAFTRIYFGLHFLTDIIAGAVLGYGIGLLILRIWEKKI